MKTIATMVLVLAFGTLFQLSSPDQYLPRDWVDGFKFGKILFNSFISQSGRNEADTAEQSHESFLAKVQPVEFEVKVEKVVYEICPEQEKMFQEQVRKMAAQFDESFNEIEREIKIEKKVRLALARARLAEVAKLRSQLPRIAVRVRT